MAAGLIGNIGIFAPEIEDFTIYCERIEQYFLANKIEDKKIQAATLLNLIGPNVYQTLRDLTSPNLPKEKTYDELVRILKNQYGMRVNVHKERQLFFDLKQQESETINDWNVKIRKTATNCKFGTRLGNMLKDKFIYGMRSGRIKDKLSEEDEDQKELKDLVEIALRIEVLMNNRAEELNLITRKSNQKIQNGHKTHERKSAGQSQGGYKSGSYASARNGFGRSHEDNEDNQQYQHPSWRHQEKKKCFVCGKVHVNKVCKYKSYKCRRCNKMGHLEAVCRQKWVKRSNYKIDVNDESNEQNIEVNMFNVRTKDINVNPFSLRIKLSDKWHEIAVDTGAAISVLNKNFYDSNLKNYKIQKDQLELKGFTGHTIRPIGFIEVNTTCNNKVNLIRYYIVETNSPNLLGRNFLKLFNVQLNVFNVSKVDLDYKDIVNKFPEVFTNKLGTYKFAKVSLNLKENAKPIYFKAHPVPLSYKALIEKELDRLVEEKVIEPITASEWGTPIVSVIKSDNSLRICGNYKLTINKWLENVRYPLPRIEEIIEKLNGGIIFTKLDLNKAYTQFLLDEEAQKITTWSTHKGMFRMLRMPYGAAPSSAIFQKHLEQLLQGMPHTINYLDDIIITGTSLQNHKENVTRVLEKLREAGLTVKQEKCEFYQTEIEYLGYIISKDGIKKTESKVKAILKAQVPTNVKQVRSFCGLVNYYNKFVPNIAQILHPIYNLLKKETTFSWNTKCQKAFEEIKQLIAKDIVLTHYNNNKQLVLVTDAANEGIAAILYQKENNGVEKPIACTSRTLLENEKAFATVDKEALAIIFGVRKFSQYLLGREFIIRTDHKPLLGLFKENKEIPQRHRDRLQRWAVYLSGFQYKLEYIKGKENFMADCLSRLPVKTNTITDEYDYDNYLNFAEVQEGWPIDNDKVKKETLKDEELTKVKQCIQENWRNEVSKELKKYRNRKEELYIENECVMWGYRVVIPLTLRKKMLEELHSGHLGITKTKTLARSYLWWPNMELDIEKKIKACLPCMKVLPDPKKQMTQWPEAEQPWERVHIDFLGPIYNSMFLIVIDSYSKWIEVFKMNKCTSNETVERLRETFARFGLPKTIISDNGRQLTSVIMEEFLMKNGIKHVTTPTYHPQSNGQAENAVKTFKNKLKAAMEDEKNKNESIETVTQRFLLNYRNSVHSTTQKTPAEMLMGRKLRIKLDLIKEVKKEQTNREEKDMYKVKEKVLVRDYSEVNIKKWVKAVVERKIGKLTFICRTENGNSWKRHANQMRKRWTEEENKEQEREKSKTEVQEKSKNEIRRIGYERERVEEERETEIVIEDRGTGNKDESENTQENDVAECSRKKDEVSNTNKETKDVSKKSNTAITTNNEKENVSINIENNRPKRVIRKPQKYTDFVQK